MPPARTGEQYLLTLIDDYSRESFIFPTKTRTELYTEFQRCRCEAELRSGHKLEALRSDNAGEYKRLGETQLAEFGIRLELTTPYNLDQNGIAETLNQTLITMARSMLLQAGMPDRFWVDAVRAASYVRNRLAIGTNNLSPEEAFEPKKGPPKVDHCLSTAGRARDDLHVCNH